MTQSELEFLEKMFNLDDASEIVPDIQELARVRDKMISYDNVEGFGFGDLIVDTKNKEIGFVIGPFSSFGESKHKRRSVVATEEEVNPTVLIVTKIQEPIDEKKFRVRYTKKNLLTSLSVEPNQSKLKADTKIFCNDQCIMACGPGCALYKYKTK